MNGRVMIPFHASQVDWEKLFNQTGGRYVGYPYQRGGSFGRLFRFAYDIVPALPDIAQAPVAKELIAQTSNVVRDISDGVNPLASIKRRGRQAVKNLIGLGENVNDIKSVRKRVIRKKKTSSKRPLFLPAL